MNLQSLIILTCIILHLPNFVTFYGNSLSMHQRSSTYQVLYQLNNENMEDITEVQIAYIKPPK